MATRTRTTQTTKIQEELQQATYQPRPLLADHPGYVTVNPSSLSVPLRAPTGVIHFATAQPEEMIQRPILSSPSLQSQVLLGGLAAGLDGGAKAHMKMGLVQEAKKETPLDQCMKMLNGGVSLMSLMTA